MTERIFLIHGWTGRTTNDWFPWAKGELQKKGYQVIVPEMPEPDYPRPKEWIGKLQEVIDTLKSGDILVGHSLGCQAILHFLETQPEDSKVKKVILIAGFEKLKEEAYEVPEDRVIYAAWQKLPINYEKIKNMAGSWVAVFSDDDPVVPYEPNAKLFKEKLGAEIILKKGMGHFSQGEGVTKIPFLLELV